MNKKRLVVVVLLVLCLAGGGYWSYLKYNPNRSTDIQATGTIEAQSVELTARNSGTLQQLDIKEGNMVGSGQQVGVISRPDLVAQDQRDAIGVKEAQDKLDGLPAGSRSDILAVARDEVERSKAILQTTEAMLADLKIVSPLAGTVISKNYETGEFVSLGASVVTVADLAHLWIKVYITTDDLPVIKLGQQANFTVSGENRTFTGAVEQIASQGEFTPKTIQTKQERANVVYAVKIRIDNAGGILKPGMPADVTIERR
jgi:HlyD family secretion protein